MKYSLLLVGLVAVASPAIADEYYIVRGPDKECRVVETRPADTTIVQVGPLAFKTREEAERERVVLCKEDSDSGDKVIIKRD
jgi:hypothetical protein